MRYTTFRAVVIGIGVCAVAGGIAGAACWASRSGSDTAHATKHADAATTALPAITMSTGAPAVATTTNAAPGSSTADTGGMPLRTMDREILDRVAKGISSAKEKDALPGRSYKVDLYKDDGEPKINRVKIDTKRTGKWDEKWDFKGDEVKRHVAPLGDEHYTEEWRLRGERWYAK